MPNFKPTKPATPWESFDTFGADEWYTPEPAKNTSMADGPSPVMTLGGRAYHTDGSRAAGMDSHAQPTTDWSSIAGAGIGAAGSAVGSIANIAGQKYAMDQQAAANAASRTLSEKLAKLQLAANREEFARQQSLGALMWALGANKGQVSNIAGGRDVRRGAIDGMDALLAKVMLRRG